MKAFLKRHWLACSVIIIAALARLLYFFDWHEVWWDSGVYFGMAKYIWSAGKSGLWEPIRPVLWPLVIGFGWWFKLNIVWFARLIEFVLALVSAWLVYLIGRKIFSQRSAVLSAIVWSFSPIVFYLSFHEYTEIPEVTLVLAAVYAFISGRYWLAGILAGLSFLAKFPAGMFLAILLICLLLEKRWKQVLRTVIGFVLPVAPYLVFNKILYGSFLSPIIDAHRNILAVVGCNIMRYKPWYQYFGWIVFDNVLNVFALLGIFIAVKEWKRQYVLPLLSVLIPLAYFSQLHCRDYRYLVLFLPFVALFAGYGIDAVITFIEQRWKLAPAVAIMVVLIVSAASGILFYQNNEPRAPDSAAEKYFKWLGERKIDGGIWSSNPVVAAYTDQKTSKIYYPVYGVETAADFNKYLQDNHEKVGAVLLDNCGGGLVCSPDDEKCPAEIDKMRAFLNENFRQVFFDQSGRCWYSIYTH